MRTSSVDLLPENGDRNVENVKKPTSENGNESGEEGILIKNGLD
jgi:hypothetical protein